MRRVETAVAGASVALGRALREHGLGTGVDDELVFCRALAEVDVRRREGVYWAARSCFLRRRDGLATFDAVFERFWAGLPLAATAEAPAEHGESDPRMAAAQHGGESLPQFRSEERSAHLLDGGASRARAPFELPAGGGTEPGRAERNGHLAAYSANEILGEHDPLEFDASELEAVRRLTDALRATAPLRPSRRLRTSRRRGRLAVGPTVARSLATDGELLRLVYAAQSRRPRRVLFVCDVSGSMERYARAVLGALHAAVAASPKTEAFVFATRLTRLTPRLGSHDAAAALERAHAAVDDWSGGTRIGHALRELRLGYGARGVARGAIVVVVSDGWDRGDPDLLARELGTLRLQCRRLVWINPRPADLDGQPLAVGMRAALPYVDDFVAGRDPRAVAELARVLAGLEPGRPERRQRIGRERA